MGVGACDRESSIENGGGRARVACVAFCARGRCILELWSCSNQHSYEKKNEEGEIHDE